MTSTQTAPAPTDRYRRLPEPVPLDQFTISVNVVQTPAGQEPDDREAVLRLTGWGPL
ncbi:hypothetical protein [Goekera deserti]|uniref:Uncharacterized protein n=1 Tax=Goekera deserti TaxID=2497753 RepID=A0A7K3WDR9_9ACTN|nr:hypothetical protein [Goekera deserti]NDI47915.1 hypothetical protein [Goekera deserti]NEL53663.1 hypothetical protein [Goekera deserti]